eukprot:980239-Alexandrium_andersonii.AAC.1
MCIRDRDTAACIVQSNDDRMLAPLAVVAPQCNLHVQIPTDVLNPQTSPPETRSPKSRGKTP